MKLLLIGHGRMGQFVESLAPSYGCEIAGIIDENSPADAIARGEFGGATVAIDFSLAAAVPVNFPKLADRKMSVVIGATGWHAHEAQMRARAERAGIGVLASANFSIGMQIFQL